MKKKFTLGVIGGGFMATSIINGLIKSKILSVEDVCVSDLNSSTIDKFQGMGICSLNDNLFVADNSEYLLFAIKPQNLNEVLESIKTTDCKKFISIMAGVKKEKIKKVISNSLVARCMPNTPCSIGYGSVGLDLSDYTCDNDIEFITSIFNSFSKFVLVEEDKLNAVTGVCGSSPAYFYLFVKGIIQAGIDNGLTEEQARMLAVNSMIGAGKMILANEDKTIDMLIDAVCSKGGTTIEAIKIYNDNKLTEISKKAVDACVKRSIELENL